MGNRMDDCADLEKILIAHQKTLTLMEQQAAIYTTSTMPPHLKIQLDEKREEVALLKAQLREAQLAKKETKHSAQSEMNRQSPMRSRVPDRHYIERDEAKRLLERFALALKEYDRQPLLFNICGTGGVGKTTLLGRLKDAHADEVDFLEICFAITADIETPLKLMRKVHEQAVERFGGETIADSFKQKEEQFESTLYKLSHESIGGETISSEEAKKIRSWFKRFIWLRPRGLTSTSSKPTSFNVSEVGFSALAAIGEDADSLQESIEQRVRNHPATKDQPELQALMLQPVSKLTQAFAESLMQIAQSTGRSLVLILDTYEKAQSYLNQWLWQYLVEDTALSSAPVRLVVVGRRSLQADEGWRKLNQDRKLLLEVPLKKFSKKDTEEYLKQIGIENGGIRAKIYKATQGLPYYLDWVRKQREQGEEPDFSKGNQAIAKLLLQGIDTRHKEVLYVVACCRWFDRAMIRYLLGSVELGLQQDADNAEGYFEWLKDSYFVEFTKGHYRLDDVARDVFRQSYFQEDQTQFRKTHALLANYFKKQADDLVTPEMFLPEQYEDDRWREQMAELLYYNLFGKGKEGLQKYIEQVFTAVYLQVPDVFMAPFAFIRAEISEENLNLLPKATGKFFKDSEMALSLGWDFLEIPPRSYEIKFEGDNTPSEQAIEEFSKQIEVSIQSLLGSVGDLKDSLGKCAGLVYKSLRCNTLRERTDSLLQAKIQCEKLTHCHPKLMYALFSSLGGLLLSAERYKEALDCYQKALELDQGNASTFLGQGVALANLKRLEEGLESLQKVIDLDPESVEAWRNRGAVLGNLKRYEEALESYQKALDLDPKSVKAWVNRGKTLHNLERYEEALESFEKAIDLAPESVDAWINRGKTLHNLERYEEVLESFEKAIDLAPESVDAWINRGVSLYNLRRHEEALESYKKALDLAPESVDAWRNRGAVLANLERYEEALESCQKVIDLAPKSVDAWVNRGNMLRNLERPEEALESYQKVIDLAPKSVDAWVNQGIALLDIKRYEEALTACERAFKIDSKNPQPLNIQALALSLLKNFEKAITAIDEAINLKPKEVLYRANHGIILARVGRYTEALAECEQAIKQDPKDESGYYGKACCYALQGEIGQAIDNLQKAIDIAPRLSRYEAKQNPDFDSIRDDERFRALMQLASF
ncbi:tetratricopeptide repeat protein [Microcoleus sp. herbarium2]|uniref:tetratricopeptide repeat protein n=1 Tax=Microcoleus sp. herbarium2 TaxID=3055433 RepID=UPI002FCEE02F